MNTLLLRKIQNYPNVIGNWLLLKRKHAVCGHNLTIYGRILIHGDGSLEIGNDVTLVSDLKINPVGGGEKCAFSFSNKGRIMIGNRVGISLSSISAAESVTIEDDVLIGANCMIADNDFHSLNADERISHCSEHIKSKPVIIRRGAFIGARSIILKGVTVGCGSVVGAGSVVAHDIPSHQIWAGNPARFIRDC